MVLKKIGVNSLTNLFLQEPDKLSIHNFVVLANLSFIIAKLFPEVCGACYDAIDPLKDFH